MTSPSGRNLQRRFLAGASAVALACACPGALATGFAPAATAIPASGAVANTPGTNSNIGPSLLAPGETLSWAVSGFPAGVPVYVKIDDGDACPSTAAQGACVITSSMVASDGTASGSFVVPDSLDDGFHWLRFLATGPAPERLGYSHQSGDFEVSRQLDVAQDQGDNAAPVDNGGQVVDDGGGGGGGVAGDGGGGGGGVDEVIVYEDAPQESGGTAAGANQAAGNAAGAARAQAAPAAPANSNGTSSGGARSQGSANRAQTVAQGANRGASGGAVLAGSAPAAQSVSSDGLSPYNNVTLTAQEETPVPWMGVTSLVVATVVACAMLGAAVFATRPRSRRSRAST